MPAEYPVRNREDSADGIRKALAWTVELSDPIARARRHSAFVLALCGLEAFPGCSTLGEICSHQKISPRTLRFLLAELRTMGLRRDFHAPSAAALDHSQPLEASKDTQTEDEFTAASAHG